ncbi:MAG: hypothetical protein MZU97_04780 [Bacillus subtilis]|nr:hypothetical protein [Bacillus subtilis]
MDAAPNRILFIDGDFELQTAITNADANLGWTLKTGTGGAFTPAVFENGYVKFAVTNVGTVPHGVQFFQRNGFTAEAGGIYKLSFRAKVDAARDIRISFEEAGSRAFTVIQFNIVSLTTEWANYEVYLFNYLGGLRDVKIGFFAGLIDSANASNSVATTLYFDDVSVVMVGLPRRQRRPEIIRSRRDRRQRCGVQSLDRH